MFEDWWGTELQADVRSSAVCFLRPGVLDLNSTNCRAINFKLSSVARDMFCVACFWPVTRLNESYFFTRRLGERSE